MNDHKPLQIKDLKPGSNLVFLYETEKEHQEVVTRFIRQGLERGEKVLYLADALTAERVQGYLEEAGVKIAPCLAGGQLQFIEADVSDLQQEVFDAANLIQLLGSETEKALAEKYNALRVTVEMAQVLRDRPGSPRLMAYQTKLHKFLAGAIGSKCLVLYQYDRKCFNAAFLLDVLNTHPVAVVGTEIYDNFYYQPPPEFSGTDPDQAKLSTRLNNLKKYQPRGGISRNSELFQKKRDFISAALQNEEFTRSIIENSPDCIKVLDLEGRMQFMSPAGQRLMNITNLSEYLNFPYLDFWQGQDRQAVTKALAQARQGDIGVFRGYCPTRDGTPKWWDVLIAPVFGNTGQVEGLLSVSRDITAQKQIEEELVQYREHLEALVAERTAALLRSNEKLQQSRRDWEEIFQAIGHSVLILDPEFTVIDANRATLAALGKEATQVVGHKCYELFHLNNRPGAGCPMETLMANGFSATVEMQVEALGGSYLVSCSPVLDNKGRIEKIIHIATDITARKRAEEALAQSEKRFKDIAENALEWIWEVDAQGKYVYASPVVEKLLGYKPEEMLNKHFYDLFHPEEREELKKQSLILFAAKQPYREFLNRNLHKNGREVFLSTSGLPVLDETGELLGYRGVDTDITERKRAEEALSKNHRELQEIAQRLEQSRNMLHKILESIPVRVFWKDGHLRYLGCNTLFARDAGLSRPEQLLGQDDFAMGWREQAELYQADDRQVMASGLPKMNIVEPQTTPAGGKIWLKTSKVPLQMANGEVFGVLGVYEDITEQVMAEEALKASEAKYRQIVETANEGIWSFDRNSRTTFVNEIMANWLGYEPVEIMGKPIKEFIFPDDLADYRRKVKERREGQNQVFERRFRRKDGSELWAIVSVTALMDDSGGFNGSFAMITDITERKRAEEKFLREKHLSDTIINSLPGAFYCFNDQGRFLRWNAYFEKVTGYTAAEFAELSPLDFFAGEDKNLITQAIQEVLLKGENTAEAELVTKDGRRIPFFFTGRRLDFEGTPCVIGMGIDIAARKQAEEQIRQSQLRLQAVFDGIPEPLIMVDRDMRLKLMNRAAISYYEIDRLEELLDTVCYQKLKGLPAPCEGCEVPAAVSKGEFLLSERQGIRDPNRLEEVFVYPLQNASSQEGAAIIRVSDVTEARLMERNLLHNEKLASLGLLVAGIAHEINNPNSFITFNLPILRSYLQELLPVVDSYAQVHPEFDVCRMPYEEFRRDIFKLVDNLEHGSSRINATVAALRDFARERVKGEKSQFDLKTVIDRVVSICQGRVRRTAKTFTVDVPDWLPPMSSDPMALEQVLVNLLINAAQALDKEESWITLTAALGETREERFIIEVNDNGCGMDAATRQRIFDPFFTTKPPGTGTGLGLSIVHRLVEELGGRIEVKSEPGQGTTFRLLFSDENVVA